MKPPFVARVTLRNYRSVAECDVRLPPLAILVGPNGAGKSNFLDALRFVRDSLRSSTDHALRDRGGIGEVRRRSSGHPTHSRVDLELTLEESCADYGFTIGAKPQGGYCIQREECRIVSAAGKTSGFRVESGAVVTSRSVHMPAVSDLRLALVAVSAVEPFRSLYLALEGMGFYNLNPVVIREPQRPDRGELLKADGSNLASVLSGLAKRAPVSTRRIRDSLAAVVPGIVGVETRTIGPRETLEFRQIVGNNRNPWRFFADNMSDGTLRILGVLVALYQNAGSGSPHPLLVGIEEPEAAIHPGAAEVLLEGLTDAAEHVQVIVTSHGSDLLDTFDLPENAILTVGSEQGRTRIAPLGKLGKASIRDRLYSPGELMRRNQLFPDKSAAALRMRGAVS